MAERKGDMDTREYERKMYGVTARSMPQRVTLAVSAGLWVALAWWLLAGNGLVALHQWVHSIGPAGNATRRLCLAACFSIYFVRILFTEFLFLKRGVSWNEVLSIIPWLLIIVLLLGIAGGTNSAPFAAAAYGGVILFVLGSWMNSYAEYQRHKWKQRPENRGRLFTGGLFRFSRHPNYFGDLISFSGLCLISGAWSTVLIPVIMLAGFVFVNIPVLDAHLLDHYGTDFAEYAQRTRKLIPYIY